MSLPASTTPDPAVAAPPLRLTYSEGSILIDGLVEDEPHGLAGLRYDPRVKLHRAEAIHYRAIVQKLHGDKTPYIDEAKGYEGKTPWPFRVVKDAFPHQVEGLEAWWQAGGRGVVVLPTGTGKTHLANLAINKAGRPSLVVTPTIDLLNQWYDELAMAFGVDVGILGGGYYDIKPLTVTTYDSAYQNVERLGNKFGLLVFDECHHLPSPTVAASALGSIAPWRLGPDGDAGTGRQHARAGSTT